jgi:hypothetical protein
MVEILTPPPAPPRHGEGSKILILASPLTPHSCSPFPRREGGWGVRSSQFAATEPM